MPIMMIMLIREVALLALIGNNDQSTYPSDPQNITNMTTFEGSANLASSAFCARWAPVISEIVHNFPAYFRADGLNVLFSVEMRWTTDGE
jgi:hypothetical protein